MALSFTLGTLVARCQRRSNKDGDSQIESTEWKELISETYGEMHSAVTETGARYFETEATLNLSNLALPSDHYQTIGVDFVIDSAGQRRELDQLMVQERTIFAGRTGPAFMFALAGTSLALYPTPSTGTYKHLYVPQPTDYSSSADSTSVDTISIHGLRFVVWGVAAIALHRDSSDQQRAMLERDKALAKVMEAAVERAKGMPKRRVITDIRGLQGVGRGMGDIHGAWNPASWIYR